jgi:hypothetical protein
MLKKINEIKHLLCASWGSLLKQQSTPSSFYAALLFILGETVGFCLGGSVILLLTLGNSFLIVVMSLFKVSINFQLLPLSPEITITVVYFITLPFAGFNSVCCEMVHCSSFLPLSFLKAW